MTFSKARHNQSTLLFSLADKDIQYCLWPIVWHGSLNIVGVPEVAKNIDMPLVGSLE